MLTLARVISHYLALLIVWWLTGFAPDALATGLSITNDTPPLHPTAEMSLLEDPTHQLTIEQAITAHQSHRFQPNEPGREDLGRSSSVWWFHLPIDIAADQPWYLQINYTHLSIIEAYLTWPDGKIQRLPADKTKNRIPYDGVLLPPKSGSLDIYLRITNYGKDRLILPVYLLPATERDQRANAKNYFFGGVTFSFLTLAAYNFILFFRLRDSSYLILTGMLLSATMMSLRGSVSTPVLPALYDPNFVFYATSHQLYTVLVTQLWRRLCDSPRLFPRGDHLIQILMAMTLVSSVAHHWFPYKDLWSYIWGMVAILVLGSLSLSSRKDTLPVMTRQVLIIQASLSIFIIPYIAWGFGLLEKYTNEVFIFCYIGLLISGILFSLILAEHTRLFRIQAERSAASSEARGSFLTTMSHELRTPMSIVIGIGELLKLTPLNTKQADYVSKLEIASQHMLSLINNILDLARIDSNSINIDNTPFTLDATTDQIRQLMSGMAKGKTLELRVRNLVHLPDKQLLGDASRLGQVLINLVNNAIKFTPSGVVQVTISPVQITPGSASIKFSVRDTGIGIEPAQQEQIFQPFAQANSSTAREYGGSGLGLSISHRLVNHMGGTLGLTSAPGKGSLFYFTLTFPLLAAPSVKNNGEPEEPRKRQV